MEESASGPDPPASAFARSPARTAATAPMDSVVARSRTRASLTTVKPTPGSASRRGRAARPRSRSAAPAVAIGNAARPWISAWRIARAACGTAADIAARAASGTTTATDFSIAPRARPARVAARRVSPVSKSAIHINASPKPSPARTTATHPRRWKRGCNAAWGGPVIGRSGAASPRRTGEAALRAKGARVLAGRGASASRTIRPARISAPPPVRRTPSAWRTTARAFPVVRWGAVAFACRIGAAACTALPLSAPTASEVRIAKARFVCDGAIGGSVPRPARAMGIAGTPAGSAVPAPRERPATTATSSSVRKAAPACRGEGALVMPASRGDRLAKRVTAWTSDRIGSARSAVRPTPTATRHPGRRAHSTAGGRSSTRTSGSA